MAKPKKSKKAAKKSKKAAKAATPAKAPAAAAEEFKYTVSDLAKELGIKEASARVRLRNANVPKAGKAYGWNSDKEFKEVVKKLKPKSAA